MAVRALIAGNWKMNCGGADGLALARAVAAGAEGPGAGCDLLLCPPAVNLAAVAEALSGTGIALGGQDCHASAAGAHTGDISAPMLAEAGAGFVIVGHSERRTDHGESDETVRGKAAAAHGAGLIAIVCIGETEAERDAGDTLAVLSRQIAGSIPSGADAANTVIAYEPVWAIGTGRTPTVEEVAEAHRHIRAEIAGPVADADACRLLYGGSVKPENAAELLAVADVNGALVGGASLDAADFLAIARAAP
ncbi:MAG: triose-phosphate isomerase [Alphaproteobacteria bacterium]|nr:triose-phosphate isomerase [Alphaproteobacteria bacterium]